MPLEARPPVHELRLDGLTLEVRLGWGAEERALPQTIQVGIEFRFHEPPTGSISDDLAGTICYAEVAERIRERLQAREYRLIERMALDAYEIARGLACGRAATAVSIWKVKPPIAGLERGAHYRCGDFRA